ncbi:DUF7683 domain-containing protein [Pseudomonas putida]
MIFQLDGFEDGSDEYIFNVQFFIEPEALAPIMGWTEPGDEVFVYNVNNTQLETLKKRFDLSIPDGLLYQISLRGE